ncbi:hypothetical protein I552_3302 [Mycobacterium xenopi 3993]|nr:hypothetical protein I552_3302 [Mycobacterium xenopi 3993]
MQAPRLHFADMGASWAWRHPTFVDLAQRQEAVADWEAMNRGGRRLASQLSAACFGLGVVAGIMAALIPQVTFVAAMATGALLMTSVLCARVWWGDPPLRDPHPQPPASGRLPLRRTAA